MSVSQEFRKMEDCVGTAHILQNDLIGAIARKLEQDKGVIAQALYHACVSVGARPSDMAFCVNEFLACLHEHTIVKEEEA